MQFDPAHPDLGWHYSEQLAFDGNVNGPRGPVLTVVSRVLTFGYDRWLRWRA